MGIYARYKRLGNGLRQLVELLESTPKQKRDVMIERGMQEDPDYTYKALQYVLTFEDVLNLPDLELAEVMVAVPPQIMAQAIAQAAPEVKERFIKNSKPNVAQQLQEWLETEVSLEVTGVSQLKVITFVRALERKGLIRTKRIPI